VIDPHTVQKDVIEFFYIFSRFEFALKESGYINTPNKNSDNATPNWDAFIKEYKKVFKPSEENIDAVNYLLAKPPQKQKVYQDESGSFKTTWEPFNIDKNAPSLKTLVDVVKTVRNNLFHGGKYGDKGWDDKARLSLLLKHSSTVIKQWLNLKEELNVYYNDWA